MIIIYSQFCFKTCLTCEFHRKNKLLCLVDRISIKISLREAVSMLHQHSTEPLFFKSVITVSDSYKSSEQKVFALCKHKTRLPHTAMLLKKEIRNNKSILRTIYTFTPTCSSATTRFLQHIRFTSTMPLVFKFAKHVKRLPVRK